MTDRLSEIVRDFIHRRIQPEVKISKERDGGYTFIVDLGDMHYAKNLPTKEVRGILDAGEIPYRYLDNLGKEAMIAIAKGILEQLEK